MHYFTSTSCASGYIFNNDKTITLTEFCIDIHAEVDQNIDDLPKNKQALLNTVEHYD